MAADAAAAGPDGTFATAGQRLESIVAEGFPMISAGQAHRGTTGTRRNHSLTPCIRMRAATTNGANGEMNCMIATCLVVAGRRSSAQVGDERRPALTVQRHRDVDLTIGSWCLHQVVAVDLIERRDVELLGRHYGQIGRRQQVGMAFAVGVVHLGDHMAQPAVAVVAPKDAYRVEDVSEDACLQQRGDAAVGNGNVAISEEGVQPIAQRTIRAGFAKWSSARNRANGRSHQGSRGRSSTSTYQL